MTPGLAVALVCHGQIAWAAGYGVADQATGEPVTPASRFQAASVSKPVTAWGVLRLVEQGRIGLDEPVGGHLRRWCPPPSPFKAEAITVRRLLSHTAGLSVHGYVGQAHHEAVMTRRQPPSTATARLPPVVSSAVREGSMVRTCHGERWWLDDRANPSRP
jgi:CubicO group peptidase (beta-lactamase class C family)